MSHRPYPDRQRALHQVQRHAARPSGTTHQSLDILFAEAADNIAAFVAAMRRDTLDEILAARPQPTVAQRVQRALLNTASTVTRSFAWPAGPARREQAEAQ